VVCGCVAGCGWSFPLTVEVFVLEALLRLPQKKSRRKLRTKWLTVSLCQRSKHTRHGSLGKRQQGRDHAGHRLGWVERRGVVRPEGCEPQVQLAEWQGGCCAAAAYMDHLFFCVFVFPSPPAPVVRVGVVLPGPVSNLTRRVCCRWTLPRECRFGGEGCEKPGERTPTTFEMANT
jgi:hypothetical protein